MLTSVILNFKFSDKDSQYELLTEQAKKQITEANKHIEDLRKKENQFQVPTYNLKSFCQDLVFCEF